MSKQRQLQQEIDKTIKKVQDGCQVFDDLWDRVEEAASDNLKEKFESELKKELKKLQRLRDQLKSWAAGSDVKHKAPLLEYRRLIETKMEKFKDMEKESKTKAYSNEGLERAAREDDPLATPEGRCIAWLNDFITELQHQIDAKEAEIEAAKSKKRVDKSAVSRFESIIAEHTMHITSMETLIRLLSNEEIDPEEVEDIKDDLDYYVTENDDPDFYGNPDVYDAFDLESYAVTAGVSASVVPTKPTSPTPSASKDSDAGTETSATGGGSVSSGKKKKTTSSAAAATAGKHSSSSSQASSAGSDTGSAKGRRGSDAGKSSSSKTTSKVAGGGGASAPTARSVTPVTARAKPEMSFSAVATGATRQQSAPAASQAPAAPPAAPAPKATAHPTGKPPLPPSQDAHVASIGTPLHGDGSVHHPQARSHAQAQSAAGSQAPAAPTPASTGSGAARAPPLDSGNFGCCGFLGAGKPLRPVDQLQSSLLDISVQHAPRDNDAPREPIYAPENPHQTQPWFPSAHASLFDSPCSFEKFDTDTLFFAFYHQPNTQYQLLAARELKRQSWRYHKLYRTWFQRYQEPRNTTRTFEAGTYLYFDYESGWCQRVKRDFKFEYQFLEDDFQV